jgi:hypothetical protein
MSEQVGEYRCSGCGAVFSDAATFSNHLKEHEGRDMPRTQSEQESQGDLRHTYAHADLEFKVARLPIFAVTLIFLLAFAVATVFHLGFFAPMFVGSVIAVIIASGLLLKFLMEG